MNKQQRKEIVEAFAALDTNSEAIAELGTEESREAFAVEIEGLKENLEGVRDAEQEKYDNMPESLQAGSKGDDLQNIIDELDSAINTLEEAAAMVRDDYPDKPSDDEIDIWASEVEDKIQDAYSTATGV